MVTGLFAGQHNTKLHGTITGVIYGTITGVIYTIVGSAFAGFASDNLQKYPRFVLITVCGMV